jgi:SAM-dependent methyltransferase
MPNPEQPESPPASLHHARRMAESFGIRPEGYDQARPGYPSELIERITTGRAGLEVLDVGCGTGIAARQLQAAGCSVLGIDPDERMAAFARERGLEVEVSTFESWEPAGRAFDVVAAAQSWHWVDPAAGARKAALVLRPRGRLAVFGHVFEPPDDIAIAFADAYRRVAPDSPFNGRGRRPVEIYQAGYTRIADLIRESGSFTSVEQWRFDWTQPYTRDEWLDLLPTTGGLTQLPAESLTEVLEAVGTAIDRRGGSFTMEYVTLASTGVRNE